MRSRLRLALLVLILSPAAGCKKELPSLALPSVPGRDGPEDAPCAGRARCVTVYLSPWCPICNQTAPVVLALRQRARASQGVGLRIVVGGDVRGQLEGMASRLGGRVYLDELGDFAQAAGIKAVPRWFVTDARRKVLADFAGGVPAGVPLPLAVAALLGKLELGELGAAPGEPPAASGAPPALLAPSTSRPPPSPDESCEDARDTEACRACCTRFTSAGYIFVRGSRCRCVKQ